MYLFIYLVIANLVAFVMYGIDKRRAVRHQWRISEAMLLGIAAIGGGIGAFAAMRVFRHKTKHMKFVIGVPVIILLHVVIFIFISIH